MRKLIVTISLLLFAATADCQWNTNAISTNEALMVVTNKALSIPFTNFFVINSNLLNQAVNLGGAISANATLLNNVNGTASLISTNSTNSSLSGVILVTNAAGPTPFWIISNNVNTNITPYISSVNISNVLATLQYGGTNLSNITAFVVVDASGNIYPHNVSGVSFSNNNSVISGLTATPTLTLSNQTSSDNLLVWSPQLINPQSSGYIDPFGGIHMPAPGGISNNVRGWGVSSNGYAAFTNITLGLPGGASQDIVAVYSNGVKVASLDSNVCFRVAAGTSSSVAFGQFGNFTNGVFFPNNEVEIVNSGLMTLLCSSNVVYGVSELFNSGLFTNLYALNAQLTNANISGGNFTNVSVSNITFNGTSSGVFTNSSVTFSSATSSNTIGAGGQSNVLSGYSTFQVGLYGETYVGGSPLQTANIHVTGTGYAGTLYSTNALIFPNSFEILPIGDDMYFQNPNISGAGLYPFVFGSGFPLINGALLAGLVASPYTNGFKCAGVDANGFGTLSNLLVLSSATVATNLTFGSITNANLTFGVGTNGIVTASNLVVNATEIASNIVTTAGAMFNGSLTNNSITTVSNGVWGTTGGSVSVGWTNTTAREGLMTVTLVGSGGSGFGAYLVSTNWDGTIATNLSWGYGVNVGTSSNSWTFGISSNTSAGIVVNTGTITFGLPASIKWQ